VVVISVTAPVVTVGTCAKATFGIRRKNRNKFKEINNLYIRVSFISPQHSIIIVPVIAPFSA
jgi:hypothetical protein